MATRTLRSVFWAYNSYALGLAISMLATALLARLLTPDDFGLIALALVAIAILDTFPGLGVGEALVVVPDDDVEENAETAFAVSVLVGLVLAGLLAALGPLAAAFFDQPRLVEIMPVLGLSYVITSLGSTHGALAQKRMDFRVRNIAGLAADLTRGGIGIALALSGAGVWSLVLGYVAGSVASVVALWALVPWRPRFEPRRAHLRGLLGFGGTLTGVAVMAAFLTQFDYIVVGRVLGAAELGFYSMATRLPGFLILGLAAVAGRVLFPAFVTLGHTGVSRALLTALRYMSLLVLPLGVYLAVLARPVTFALFGDQWGQSVDALRVLCIWACATTFLYVCGSAFKARGRADLIFKLAVPQAVALVIGSLVLVDYGITAIAWAQAVIAVCAFAASTVVAKWLFEFEFRQFERALRAPVAGSVALGASLLVVDSTVSSPWPAVIIGGAVGTIVYAVVIGLVDADALRKLRSMAFPVRAIRSSDDNLERALEPADKTTLP